MAGRKERWSLSLPQCTRLLYTSLSWLSPRASYSISTFSRSSLRACSTGLLTHVRRIDVRWMLFPCCSSRFWHACLVFGNRISPFACNTRICLLLPRSARQTRSAWNVLAEFVAPNRTFIWRYYLIFTTRERNIIQEDIKIRKLYLK